MADKQRVTRGATESRKRKGKIASENSEESKKKRCTSKAIGKKDRSGLNLMKFLQCIDSKILVDEMQRDVLEHFTDGNLGKFARELFENGLCILTREFGR